MELYKVFVTKLLFFKKVFVIGFALNFIWVQMVIAEPLNKQDVSKLQRKSTIEHLLYEVYLDTDKGVASVIGYHFDTFYHENIYLSLAILGAVGGSRGGYGIAAFGLGYRQALAERFWFDSKILLGSGGGGGIPAGGGFALEALAGISCEIMNTVYFDIKAGFLTFPSGEFSTPVLQFGLSLQTFQVFLPWN
ncbi:hypothetical protein ACFL96_01930 [Thermoproteota archaeon]